MEALTSAQFQRFARLIYEKLGLMFEDRKLYFLASRLQKRAEARQVDSLEQYHFLLAYCDNDGKELQELANLITTNETYMFREFEQLQAFADHCLPEVLEAKNARGQNSLRIWSAGCSTGEEAYTLAIIVREILGSSSEWNIEIIATDIDENCLSKAKRAVYGKRSTKDVPEAYRKRHLVSDGDLTRINPETARLVSFQHLNLNDRTQMRSMRNMDFVFCRNVLIYFDDASRKSAVDHFYNALNAGGYLFLGHSESVGRISNAFRLSRLDQHLVYSKGTR